MQIEMVATARGMLPVVALEKRERVVEDTDDRRTVQVDWHLIETGEIVRQDGRVDIKRWPEDMALFQGGVGAGGEG